MFLVTAVRGVVAMSWVVTLMLMVLIPSAAQWLFRTTKRVLSSPARIVRGTLASRLGQDCCTSRDPLDHILALKDEHIVAQTHRIAINNFTLRVDRLFLDTAFGQPGFVPVILQHGVLQSGGIFLCNGKHSMAATLASAGFDVWVANSRGCFCNAADDTCPDRWNWTLDELGSEDVPALVHYVAAQTGRRVVFAGHSQGGSSGIVAFNTDTDAMRRDVRLFVGLAPAMLLKQQHHWFFTKVLMPHPAMFEVLGGRASFAAALFAIQDHLPNVVWSLLGVWAVSYLFAWRPLDLWRPECIGQYFCFAPAKTSSRLVTNWIRMLMVGRIRNATTGKPYSLRPLNGCRVALFYGENDALVECGEPFQRELRDAGCNVIAVKGIPQFDHMDVLWARTAPMHVFAPMIDAIHASADPCDADFSDTITPLSELSPVLRVPILSSSTTPERT